jgi:colanic acid/amylovoran biosynthesis glycosyltransferase
MVRVGYIVSRFPHFSETFILREIEQLRADPRFELELFSLFPPVGGAVHPAAEPWIAKLRRPSPAEGVGDLAWWTLRRPLRVGSSLATVLAGYWRKPAMLARALSTFPLAAAHARRVRRDRLQHLHAHYATWPALSAWICNRLTGVPYSFTVHAHDLYVDPLFVGRRVDDAAFVVAISEFNKRILTGMGGPRARIEVVHCGVDPANYPFRPRRPAPSGPVRGLCVASLQEYKGHRYLLRALAGSAELERLRLDLVGDGELRAALETEARELGLADRVTFHGSLPEARVIELIDAADLFVLPSTIAADGQMEGIPVALMEALAGGLLVVTTRTSGVPELVRDGETGLLAAHGDAEDLRRVLEAALSGAAEVDPRRGRELVEREFDIHQTGRRVGELILGSAAGAQPASTSS